MGNAGPGKTCTISTPQLCPVVDPPSEVHQSPHSQRVPAAAGALPHAGDSNPMPTVMSSMFGSTATWRPLGTTLATVPEGYSGDSRDLTASKTSTTRSPPGSTQGGRGATLASMMSSLTGTSSTVDGQRNMSSHVNTPYAGEPNPLASFMTSVLGTKAAAGDALASKAAGPLGTATSKQGLGPANAKHYIDPMLSNPMFSAVGLGGPHGAPSSSFGGPPMIPVARGPPSPCPCFCC
mmetsp:Transcript_62467/g.145399  ORF Transcript_62467/g.145399 Transcript_62467/m.145399 type:complete len:236 (-) Transcript_62467:136-843(-)